MPKRPLVVALAYCIVSFVWIVVSDVVVYDLVAAPRTVTSVSIVKGLLFVCLSALLIVYLLRRADTSMKAAQVEHDARTESEKRFRTLADTAPVLIWMSGADAKCDFFNQTWLEFTGRSLADEIGDGWTEGVHGDDFDRCLATYVSSFNGRRPFSMEYRLRRRDGEFRWILDTGVPRYSENGVFAGYIGSCIDITDIRRAHEQLQDTNASLQREVALASERIRKSEARFRRIVENAQEGIWDINAEGMTTFVNASMAEMLGYTPQEMMGKTVFQFCAPEWREIVAGNIARGAAARYERQEIGLTHKNGSGVWVIVTPSRVYDGDAFCGSTAVVTDITDRRAAERRLQEYASELSTLIKDAPYGICRATREGLFRLVNPAMAKMLGYESPNELMKVPVRQLYADPSASETVFSDLTKLRAVAGREFELLKRDGTTIKVRASGMMLDGGDSQVFVEDITHAAALEEKVRQAAKLESVGRLAGGVAHDFNNLLMVITSNLEMALDNNALPDVVRKRIGDAMHASRRAANLTSQLLAFSRRQVLRPQRIRLNDTVQSVTRMVERVIGEDIRVRIECDPALGTIEVDPSQIEAVLMNLAVNARDAMPEGGTLSIETSNVVLDDAYGYLHQGVAPGRYVMLAVSDTGVGMSTETMRHIFEPFFTTKEQGRGTGLGLATVYGIVKQSNGYIWVYSEEGQGSTFKLYFPRIDADPDAIPDGDAVVAFSGGGAILIVEDESLIREAISGQLKNAGYTVLEAATGEEALRVAIEHRTEIRAVLTDVVLPDANGKTLAKKICEIVPDAPVIHMSGYTPDVVVHHGVLEPGTHFLQKPFTRAQLLTLLSQLLETAEPGS